MTVGERINQERKKKHLTMEALGDLMGVGKSAINKWEKDKIERIKRTDIIKMAKIFDCDPAWLGGYKDELESFATPEEFELRWHQIGGGRHSLILSDEEQELVLEYRVASDDDKRMVRRMLAYATKMKGGDPDAKS